MHLQQQVHFLCLLIWQTSVNSDKKHTERFKTALCAFLSFLSYETKLSLLSQIVTFPSLPSTVKLSPVRTSFSRSHPKPTITGISRLFARIAECDSDEPNAVKNPVRCFHRTVLFRLGENLRCKLFCLHLLRNPLR